MRPPGIVCALITLALLAAPVAARAEAADLPDVQEIVKKANAIAYYQGKDGRAKVTMTITDDQGRQREKKFTILRADNSEESEGDQKFYLFFTRPADVSKMAFMVWKHVDGDDDRWLYLPALDLVKRIAATDKRTSFVGSDFFYEDVSGRGINEDLHELDPDKISDTYFVLKNTPKDPDSVEFSHYLMWVHRESFITVKVEYFDKSGQSYRVYSALKVETIQGHPTVTQSRMENLKSGGKTLLDYEGVEYDIDLPDDIFTERYLKKPPIKYLR